jgi:hypothetical protein
MSFSLKTLDVFVKLLLPRAKTLCSTNRRAKSEPADWRVMFDPVSGIGVEGDFRRRGIIGGPAAAIGHGNAQLLRRAIWYLPPVQESSWR